MNIIYIRAAIEDRLGVRLKLEDLRDILLELGLITPKEAKRCIFPGYEAFFASTPDNVGKGFEQTSLPPVDAFVLNAIGMHDRDDNR
jgi:hypothetical protein